jgi:hypothetical protein
VIYSIQLILKQNNFLYLSPESIPFNITQYSPLYYIICDNVISLLQIDIEDFFSIRIITRIISFIFLILSIHAIYKLFQNLFNFSKKHSLIIALVYLFMSFPWFNISRPDVLVLLAFITSIRCILSYLKNEKKISIAILLGLFMTIGIFSKLTMLIYIFSFGICLIMLKKYKFIIITGLSLFLFTSLFFVVFQFFGYDFTFLFENIIKGVDNGTSFFTAWDRAYKLFFLYFGLLTIIFFIVTLFCFKRWTEVKSNSILFFLITISYLVVFFSFSSALKIGSAINYFNEMLLCMIIFISYFMEIYQKLYKKIYLICLMIFGEAIAINQFFTYTPNLVFNSFFLYKKNEYYSDIESIVKFLKPNLNNSYFYSECKEVSMSFPLKCILFPNDIHNITYSRKVFNYSKIDDWARENLKFIIVSKTTTELFGLNINKHYSLKSRYKYLDLYELSSK